MESRIVKLIGEESQTGARGAAGEENWEVMVTEHKVSVTQGK